MADNDARFVHESLQDAKTVKTLLNALSKGFAKGEMTLSDEENELTLQTAELVNVRITAARENGQCSFNLCVTWAEPNNGISVRKQRPQITPRN